MDKKIIAIKKNVSEKSGKKITEKDTEILNMHIQDLQSQIDIMTRTAIKK